MQTSSLSIEKVLNNLPWLPLLWITWVFGFTPGGALEITGTEVLDGENSGSSDSSGLCLVAVDRLGML